MKSDENIRRENCLKTKVESYIQLKLRFCAELYKRYISYMYRMSSVNKYINPTYDEKNGFLYYFLSDKMSPYNVFKYPVFFTFECHLLGSIYYFIDSL